MTAQTAPWPRCMVRIPPEYDQYPEATDALLRNMVQILGRVPTEEEVIAEIEAMRAPFLPPHQRIYEVGPDGRPIRVKP